MLLLALLCQLFMPWFIQAQDGSDPCYGKCTQMTGTLSVEDIADAFYKSVSSKPSLAKIYDTTLPADAFYQASLQTLKNLGIPDFKLLSDSVKDVVQTVFPKINPDKSKRVVTTTIAQFLLSLGMVNESNLQHFIDLYTSKLQEAIDKSGGDPSLVAKNGFNGLVATLVDSGALHPGNADDFFKPLFHAYNAAASTVSPSTGLLSIFLQPLLRIINALTN